MTIKQPLLYKVLLMALLWLPLASPAEQIKINRCDAVHQAAVFVKPKGLQIKPGFTVSETGKIKIKLTDDVSLAGKAINLFGRILEIPLGARKLEQVLRRLLDDKRDVPYFKKLSDAYFYNVIVDENFEKSIPPAGVPTILVMNHCCSARDTMAGIGAVGAVRGDVMVVMTKYLEPVPGMKDNAIFIDFSDKADREAAKKKMDDHIKAGGLLFIHPEGKVALSPQQPRPWIKGVGELILNNPNVKVMTTFAYGRPSRFYRAMDKILPDLSPILNVMELSRSIGQTRKFSTGPVMDGQRLASIGSAQKIAHFLGELTYSLNNESIQKKRDESGFEPLLQEPIQPELVQTELYRSEVLADVRNMKVSFLNGQQSPNTIKELGRLREITFRPEGEGSGKSLDNDSYDFKYEHIVAQDKKKNMIVGAYRAAFVDKILQKFGLTGLYCQSLFDMSRLFNEPNDSISPERAIEVGRAFVLPEYQGKSSLLAIWNGIGNLFVKNPQYKNLYGMVSISGEYTDFSKLLIMSYLKLNFSSPNAQLVTPRSPVQISSKLSSQEIDQFVATFKSYKEFDQFIKSIEGDKGVPPMVGMYAALGAKYFAFNLDKDFNSIDGFMVVDLAKVSYETLSLYMGREGARAFLDYQLSHP